MKKNIAFLMNQRIFQQIFNWTNDFFGITCLENYRFLLNKHFFRTNFEKKSMVFLCSTNVFSAWSFSEKRNEIHGKLTIILRTNEINCFWTIEKKRTKWDVHEQWNEMFTNDERIKWKKNVGRAHFYLNPRPTTL